MRTAAIALLVALAGCSAPVSTPSPTATLTEAQVTDEVVALHQFFERWFRGEVANDDEAFAPLPRALGPEFVIISPQGTVSSRAAVVKGLRAAHGSWAPTDAIWIDEVAVRHRDGETIVATYQEWQRRDGHKRGRTSTVVLSADRVWLHLHETWLP